MWARLVPSRRAALLFVGALGVVLAFVLASESARVPQRTPLVPRAARGEPLAIPLEGRETRRGSRIFRLTLRLHDPAALARHEELWLYLSSDTKQRHLVGAELRVRGSQCALAASGRDDLREDQPTVFVRSPACFRVDAFAGGADLDLTVDVKGDGVLFLLGFEPLQGAEPGTIQVPTLGPRPAALDVRGHFVWYPETAPRIVLLNHMWRLSPGLGWLAGFVLAGVGLALAGSLVFPTRPLAAAASPSAAAILRAGAGASLLAGSLALLHAVLAPPLSGPDEPYHLLGFAELTQNPALAKDTVVWMGETHLWRIRQQPAERFRTIDVGAPYVVEDDQLRATEVAMRSAVLARLWAAFGPPLAGQPAPRVLLALRLLNTLVFALAVGVATAFVVATVAEPFPQWLTFAFLFVPSLPFFAMHVSETALLCSIYLLLATGLAVMFLDGPRARWAGAPVGLATGLMLAGGRSPWPLAGLVALALMGRVLLGSRVASGAPRAALVFWAGLAPGAALFFLLQDDAYRAMTDSWSQHFARFIPSWLRASGEWLRTQPAAVAGLIAGGAALELALRGPRAWVAGRLAERARPLVRRAALVLAVLVLLTLAGSLLVRYPQLPLAPLRPLSALERIAAVLGSMATMFRVAEPDFLLASSFWVGFGWLDTMPGPAFQALLVLLVALALVALLLHIALRREVRRFLWLLILGAGAVASLILYVLATQMVPMALGGRYVVGWYLAVLAIVGAALTLDIRSSEHARAEAPPPSGGSRAALLLMLAGPIHVYCLGFILRRYF